MQLTEEEDQVNLQMIGGIHVFLPHSLGEVEIYAIDAAIAEAGQPTEIVREALEQTLEVAKAKREDEHSEECLNAFIQEAEEAASLKLIAEEAEEEEYRLITPWEMELEMLEDWLNNLEPAGELAGVELSEKMTK
jgi:hypothetical protein